MSLENWKVFHKLPKLKVTYKQSIFTIIFVPAFILACLMFFTIFWHVLNPFDRVNEVWLYWLLIFLFIFTSMIFIAVRMTVTEIYSLISYLKRMAGSGVISGYQGSHLLEVDELYLDARQLEKSLKSLHQSLQRSNRQLKVRNSAIVDVSHDAIIGVDRQGIVNLWNLSAEKMFGFSSQVVMGEDFTKFIMPVEFREMHLKRLSQYFATRSYENSSKYNVITKQLQSIAIRADGSTFPVEVTVCQISENELVGFIRDITTQKSSEFQRELHTQELQLAVNQRTQELEQLKDKYAYLLKVMQESQKLSTEAIKIISQKNGHE